MTPRGEPFRSRVGGWVVALTVLAGACQGPGTGPTPSDADGPGGAPGTGGQVGGSEPKPSAQGRIFRLRRDEWLRSVRDLFNLAEDIPFETELPKDPVAQGYLFEGQAESLRIDQTLFLSYQRAAQEAAELLTRFPEVVDQLAPAEGFQDESARARGFVSSLLYRAFRRAVTDEEIGRYSERFTLGSISYDDRDAFSGGVRLVIESVLQSPYFIYRTEFSNEADARGLVPLNGFERASRLSYLLWGTAPDAELLSFAESGVLDDAEGVRAVVVRMLDDERANQSVRYFFERVFETDRFARISPSPNAFPDAPTNLQESAREELRRFVIDGVFRRDGGVRELLTSLETYVNADLAKVYGVEAPTSGGFEAVELPESERAGILTQVGFLASHATSIDPDPIHRGVFVAKNIACLTISAPPANIPPLPAPEGRTNREVVASHTEEPDTICAECHSTLINPFGFPFESYDAIGAYRTMDRGQPVDSVASPLIDGTSTRVEGAVAMAKILAESKEVHRCFARRLIEMGQGRNLTVDDEFMAESLGERSLAQKLSFSDLLLEFATSDAFLFRTKDAP
jgi:Protein of unknown function (DUF1592)/Protein of unknown function (DUF1588)/Protein of unknown function (DUF1595)/Protein of unknown function (DUF1585)/Protein of unknown function (DUF1587)